MSTSKILKRKKFVRLNEMMESEIPSAPNAIRVKLCEIFTFDEDV
jgi:hypothetical protein